MVMNIHSTGSYTIDNGSAATVKLAIRAESGTAKVLMIETSGALRFSGHTMFERDGGIWTITAIAAGTVTPLNYTEIREQKIYDLTPLALIGNDELTFTITNASGGGVYFQMEVLF